MSDPLADTLTIIARRNPNLSPGLTYAAASTDNPARSADAFSAVDWTSRTIDQLRYAHEDYQRQVWGSFSENERTLLKQAGYHPPEQPKEGFFSGLLHGAEHVLLSPLHNSVVSGALKAAGAPLQLLNHLYRTMEVTAREEGLPQGLHGTLPMLAKFAGDPGKFSMDAAKAWRDTKDGDHYIYQPDQVASDLPALARGIALDAAKGFSESDLYAKYSPKDVYDAQQHPDYPRTVAEFQSRKVSPGRDAANLLGIKHLYKPGESTQIPIPGAGKLDVYHYVSGALDGAWDWWGDPTIHAGGLVRSASEARHLVGSAADVVAQESKPGVQRAYARLIGASQDGAAGVLNAFPKLHPVVAEELGKLKPQTFDEVSTFFQSKAELAAAIEGRGKTPVYLTQIPSDSLFRPAALATKDAAKRSIDRLVASENPAVRRFGRVVNQFVNLTATGDYFDAGSSLAVSKFRQIALYGLTNKDADLLTSAFAEANLAGRHQIYRSMLETVKHHLDPSGTNLPVQKYLDEMIGRLEHNNIGLHYAGDPATGEDISKMMDEAGSHAAGVSSEQISPVWAMPEYRQLADKTSLLSYLRREYGWHIPEGYVHRFMEQAWKPLTLIRVGFPLRVGGEEAARAMLAGGFLGFAQGRLAASGLKNLSEAERALMDDEIAVNLRALGKNRRQLADYGLSDAHAPIVRWAAHRTVKAFAESQLGLAGSAYERAAMSALHVYGSGMLPDALHAGYNTAALDTPQNIVRNIRDGKGKLVTIELRPGGKYKAYRPRDSEQSLAWASEINQIKNNGELKVWLEHHADQARAIDEVRGWLHADEQAGLRSMAERASRHPSIPDASTDVAIDDWASKIDQRYRSVFYDASGRPSMLEGQPIVDLVRGGHIPSAEELEKVAEESRPAAVRARGIIAVHPKGLWAGVRDATFQGYIDPMINWISRQPMFIHELAQAQKEIAPRVASLATTTGEASARRLGDEWALQKAQAEIIPYIHDPEIRSQFQQAHRAAFPFWFAQEQWLKRWTRTIVRDPSVIRKAQLVMAGMQHSGMLGEDGRFTYPLVGGLHALMTRTPVGQLIFGKMPEGLPSDAVGFSGAPAGLSASLSEGNPLKPNVGPLITVPLHIAASRFVELKGVEKQVSGEFKAQQSLWEHLLPSVAVRAIHARIDTPDSSEQMASAMISAAAYLQAAGHGLPETATPEEQDAYLDRVKNWARSILVLRTVYGFAAPTSIQTEFKGEHWQEYRDILAKLPIDEANAEFVRRHPDLPATRLFEDASAYELAKTKTKAGSMKPLPASELAGQTLDAYPQFFKKYGSAATWFLPSAAGAFDRAAYTEELGLGLRARRSPADYVREVKVRAAATEYFESRRVYQEASAGRKGQALRDLQGQWRDWKEGFLNTHPLFAEDIAAGSQRQNERRQTLLNIETALKESDRPTINEEGVREVVDGLRAYQNAFQQLQLVQGTTKTRAALTKAFSDWGHGLSDPVARQMFMTLIEPDIQEN